jgi:hypothetical protein
MKRHTGIERREVETHRGVKVLEIDWDDRDPEKHPKWRRAFKCVNPDDNPDCLSKRGKTYAWYAQLRDPEWGGRCKVCIKARGNHRRHRGKETNEWGSTIDLDKRDSTKKKAEITCGFPDDSKPGGICGKKRMVSLSHWWDKDGECTGYCKTHPRMAKGLLFLIKQHRDKIAPATAYKTALQEAESLIKESTPDMVRAKALARRSLAKDWRAEVRKAYPDLKDAVLEMLPTAKPSECALEQIARSRFEWSGSSLKKKLRQQRRAAGEGATR